MVTLSYVHSINFTNHEHAKIAVLQIYQIFKNWYSDLYMSNNLSLLIHDMNVAFPNVDSSTFHWKGYDGGTQCPFVVIAALCGMNVAKFSDIEVRFGYLYNGHNIKITRRISDALLFMSRLINMKSKQRYLANIECTFPLKTYDKEESILEVIQLLDEKESSGEVNSVLPLIHAITWCDHAPWGSFDECFYKVNEIIKHIKLHQNDRITFKKYHICKSCMSMLLGATKSIDQLTDRQKVLLLVMMSRGNSEVQETIMNILRDKEEISLEVHPDMQ